MFSKCENLSSLLTFLFAQLLPWIQYIYICIPDHQFNEYIAVPTIRPLILVLPLLGDRRTTIGGVLFRTKQKRYTNFTSNQKFINVVKKDSCTHY